MHSAAHSVRYAAICWLAASVAAQTTTPPPSTASAATPTITAVSDCHAHGTAQWCMVGTEEYQVVGPTKTEEMESQYTDCHTHGSDTYCVNEAGDDVQILVESEEHTEEEHTEETTEEPSSTDEHCHFHAGVEHCTGGTEKEETTEEPAGTGEHCHFHAGVEHCVGAGESEGESQGSSSSSSSCGVRTRDYNIPLRIGLLFVILVTSGIGVFAPILATSFTRIKTGNIVFVILKQFGTGVVLSTAFIHLFTHADLMFGNSCLGELKYEGTTAAIFLAGLFLSFLVDYLGARFVQWRQAKHASADVEVRNDAVDKTASSTPSEDLTPSSSHDHHGVDRPLNPMEAKINVLNLEAGILFHSILIGLTLVVAGDSFFITLFIVILFHQMFEGIALGTCIAELPRAAASLVEKCIMGLTFAVITPIGMAIGIGVLNKFNGNDPSTIVAIGTLDALSAGILAWVGIVEMLARDWMHGPLLKAGMIKTLFALLGLVSGMVLMSVLGKWA